MTDRDKFRAKPLAMFMIAYIAYASIYAARLNFSVAASVFQANGILTRTQIGIIGSAFSLTYALAKVPNGYMGDRFSARLIIVIGLCLTAASNILIGFFPGFRSIAVFWGLNAFGQSMLWGPILRSFTASYPEKVCKNIMPYLASCIGIGGVLGLWIAARTATVMGEAACFFIPGGLCLIMAVTVQLFFLNAGANPAVSTESIWTVVKKFLRDKRFLKMVPPALAHGMVKDNINTWLVIYFVDTFLVDLSEMSILIYFVPILSLLGRLLFPLFYRIIGDNRRVSAISFALTGILSLVLCMGGIPLWVGAVCLGVIAALASLINTHIVTMFPQEEYSDSNLSFASSTMDLIVYGGAGIGSLIFGFLIDRFGFGAMFAIWGVSSLISAVTMLQRKGIKSRSV